MSSVTTQKVYINECKTNNTISVAFDLKSLKNNKIKVKKEIDGLPFILSFGEQSLCDGNIWRIVLTKDFDTIKFPVQIKFDTYIYDSKCVKFGEQKTEFKDFDQDRKSYMCYNFGYIKLAKNCDFITKDLKILCALRNIEIKFIDNKKKFNKLQ